MATDSQVRYIVTLLAQRLGSEQMISDIFTATKVDRAEDLTTRDASILIDGLKRLPFAAKVAERVARTVAPEGMHKFEDEIYKVQKSPNSGNLYAKRLVSSGLTWRFDYAPGVVRSLSEATKMSLEDAKAFGALYGTCCACGRTLTDENSIEAGIGPVCATRFA